MSNPQSLLTAEQVNQINQLLKQASKTVLSIYQDYVSGIKDIAIRAKADESPVTQADITVHDIITKGLADITPDIFCLSEESVDGISTEQRQALKHLWLLDPVDGTKAFIRKTGEFTINLALIVNHQVYATWLVVPTKHQLFFVINQHPQPLKTRLPIHYVDFQDEQTLSQLPVDSKRLDELDEIKVGMSRSANINHYQSFIDAIAKHYQKPIRIVRAYSAYKYVLMMENEIDVYIRAYPTGEWDTASGQGFIEHLGGELMSFAGLPFLYNARKSLTNGAFVCFKHVDDKPTLLSAVALVAEKA